MNKLKALRISMQFFAEGGEGGSDVGGGDNSAPDAGQGGQPAPNPSPNPEPPKADARDAEILNLKKQIDDMKKANMDEQQRAKYEAEQKKAEYELKLAELAAEKNRSTALQELAGTSLAGNSVEVLDFVIGKDEAETKSNVKKFSTLVDKLVKAGVEETFKQHGRNPNGGGVGTGDSGSDKSGQNSLASQLGQRKAEQLKQSKKILDFYTGGRK